MIYKAYFTEMISSIKQSNLFDSRLQSDFVLNYDTALATLYVKHAMIVRYTLFDDFVLW